MKKIRMYLAVVAAVILIGSIIYYYTIIPKTSPPITQVTLAMITETDHLDPQQATWIDYQTSVIFSSLIDINAEGQAVPALARKFEIFPDGKIVTFFLDERAKFHDGTPVTVEDVKFSIERYLRLSPYKEDLADIES